MPDSVRRAHMQERLVEGAMFVNPPLPGAAAGLYPQAAPQVAPPPTPSALPPGQQVIDGQAAPTRLLSGEMWGQLVIVGGPKQGVIFPLRQPVVSIGRDGGNDIVLQDSAASGQHARIERRGEQTFIVDLGSSNGTFVNGQRAQQAQLVGGETILIGNTHLRFDVL